MQNRQIICQSFTVHASNPISFVCFFCISYRHICGLCNSIGWQNKKKDSDGWDDEPAPAKSTNGKPKSDDWDDGDDWGSSSKRARSNGNRLLGNRHAFCVCF